MTTLKATTAEASLRTAVREAHGVLKDMRSVLADLRQERRAVEQLLDGIPARVDERIERQVVGDAVRLVDDGMWTRVQRGDVALAALRGEAFIRPVTGVSRRPAAWCPTCLGEAP